MTPAIELHQALKAFLLAKEAVETTSKAANDAETRYRTAKAANGRARQEAYWSRSRLDKAVGFARSALTSALTSAEDKAKIADFLAYIEEMQKKEAGA